MDKDAFARLVMGAIAAAGDRRPITYDRESFTLSIHGDDDDDDDDGGDRANLFFLGNAHREYVEATSEGRRAEIVRRWVTMSQTRDTGESFAEALVTLMPRVRDRAYYGILPLQLRARGMSGPALSAFSHTPVGDVLAMSLTRDLPTTIEEVTTDQLATWGVTYERAHEVAMANLARRSDGTFEGIAEGVLTSPWRDNFDVSRMLLVARMRELPTKGDPVVIAANRDHLLVTGADDADGLVGIAAIAEEILAQPRPLSGCALRLDRDGRWSPFLPPAGHPAHLPLYKLSASSWIDAYGEQKSLLEALHEKDGDDVFVATHSAVVSGETGFSYAVWGEGVDSLLPHADYLMLASQSGGVPVRIPFARALAVASHLLEPVELYPPRWRARTFPDEATLRRLSADDTGGTTGATS